MTTDLVGLLPSLVDHLAVGVFIVDRQNQVILWNEFMASHSGRPADQVVGKDLFELFPELPRKWLEKKLESVFVLKNFAFTSWEQRPYLFAFSHNRPVTGGVDQMQQNCVFTPLMGPGETEPSFIAVTIFDVTDAAIYQTELAAARDQLEAHSITDALTAVYNRRYLEQRLASEFNRARRHGSPLSFILFDLDHFKRINDTYGHPAGDEVLRAVAQRVKGVARNMDVFGRYGGEEFALILPDTDLPGAQTLAERVREGIEHEPILYNGLTLTITASVGVSALNPSLATPEAMVQAVDDALYHAKRHGRNQVCVALPGRTA